MIDARRCFAPTVTWDPEVKAYFTHSFGQPAMERISQSLCRPSLKPTLRINTLKTSTTDAAEAVRKQLKLECAPLPHKYIHSTLVLPGTGPNTIDYDQCGGKEVVVNRYAAEAILKGAQVYAPGLLAATKGVLEGELVAVTVALEQQKPGKGG
eukprot:gene24139-9724_t